MFHFPTFPPSPTDAVRSSNDEQSNIGNAKVAGLVTDLKLDGQKFNIALAIFYITYIASEIPSNMMLRKLGAKFWLPFIVFCWGVITVFFGLVKNFAGLCVIRLLLGLFEGGLLPGMPVSSITYHRRCPCFLSRSAKEEGEGKKKKGRMYCMLIPNPSSVL